MNFYAWMVVLFAAVGWFGLIQAVIVLSWAIKGFESQQQATDRLYREMLEMRGKLKEQQEAHP